METVLISAALVGLTILHFTQKYKINRLLEKMGSEYSATLSRERSVWTALNSTRTEVDRMRKQHSMRQPHSMSKENHDSIELLMTGLPKFQKEEKCWHKNVYGDVDYVIVKWVKISGNGRPEMITHYSYDVTSLETGNAFTVSEERLLHKTNPNKKK